MTIYRADYAWVGGAVARDVRIEVSGGVFTAINPDFSGWADAADGRDPADGRGAAGVGDGIRLTGLVLPGLANAHSHAFHRALRGRTHRERGTFWTWRRQMYAAAERLDPDSYQALARAVFAEMATAGYTAVGEFHYLHHGPDGRPYADPNAMGHALIAAAAEAGIRITLLDTLYLQSSVDGKPLEGVQRRFGDGDLDRYSERVGQLRPQHHARIGAALHSVRAVPAEVMAPFADRYENLMHVHLSEQRAENEQCRAVHGRTPAELLDDAGFWQGASTAVHATHLTDDDIRILGGSFACFCPTTERDLADGIGPARRLADAGARLCLGSDSHAVIDPFEEARGLEMNERLATERRGHFSPAELVAAAAGHASIGWDDAGEIAVGKRADLVAVALDSVRTAGCEPAGAVLAATAADVTDVIVDGRHIVSGRRHTAIDVPRALAEAIG